MSFSWTTSKCLLCFQHFPSSSQNASCSLSSWSFFLSFPLLCSSKALISSLQHSFFFLSRKFLVVSTFTKVPREKSIRFDPNQTTQKSFSQASMSVCFQPSLAQASLKLPYMFSTQLHTSFSQAFLYVFNRAQHKLLSSYHVCCFQPSFPQASLKSRHLFSTELQMSNSPVLAVCFQPTFTHKLLSRYVLPKCHWKPRTTTPPPPSPASPPPPPLTDYNLGLLIRNHYDRSSRQNALLHSSETK